VKEFWREPVSGNFVVGARVLPLNEGRWWKPEAINA